MFVPLFKKQIDLFSNISLETERLILRPPVTSDAINWVDIRNKSRQSLEPFEPKWPNRELNVNDFRKFLKNRQKQWQIDTGYCFLLFKKDNNQLIGNININNVMRGVSQSASVGYWIGQDHINNGYMSEGLKPVLNYAFTSLKLHKITASCMPHNIASIKVLEKVNFAQEGYVKKHLKIAGKWEDHLLFGILKENTNNTI